MAFLSMELSDLVKHRPERTEPDDFDAFWADTLAEARAAAPAVLRVEDAATALTTVTVQDVTFAGFAGQPIKGWFVRPRGAEGPLPTVVTYVGYGGGRGLPHDHLLWASAGY